MKVSDAKKIISVIMVSFPNYRPVDINMTAKVWAEMLADYTYEQVSTALREYILSEKSGFAPSIGQIIERIHMDSAPNELNEMQAWELVSKALRNGGYHAEEEFNKLPPVVQKAVGAPGMLRAWAMTDEESVENVIQSNFMRAFRIEAKREHERNKIKPNERDNWRRIEPQGREGIIC